MLGPYEPPHIQKSSYLFSFSVHKFSKIDDKMPNLSILTTLVKLTGKYNRGRSNHAREIVQSLNIFQARMLKFGIDRLHPYLRKSPKEISVDLTKNDVQPVYRGLGAQRPPPCALHRVNDQQTDLHTSLGLEPTCCRLKKCTICYCI